MHSTPRPRLALLLSLSVLVAGISYATASAAAPTIPKPPKVKVAKVEIEVAGFVEIRRLVDTTSDCFPGVTYVQTNRFEFETGRYVRTKISNISFPGRDSVITSPFSRASGSATIEGLISGYRTTNYCTLPKAPEPEEPRCDRSGRLKIAVALTPGGIPGDGDLVGLGGSRLMLSIFRHGLYVDDPSCPGGVAERVRGVDADTAVVSTSLAPGVSEVLPSGVGAIKVFNLGRRERLRRVIVIDGPCRSVRARALMPPGDSPAPGALNADGDCWLRGKVVLSVRAARD